MTPSTTHPLSGLLAFWAEAGVEFAYEDKPVDRLAEGARRLTPKPLSPAVSATPSPPARSPLAAHDAEAFDLAKAAAAQAADLPGLEAAIAAFPWGGLKARTARTVFARGPADAPVMLIGEGPGAEEDQRGEPFVGRSGQLLDRILAAGGLEDRVFITNTVFWRPSADRTPSQAEQAICLPFMERAIALVKPRVLLLAGAPRPSICSAGTRVSSACAAVGSTGPRKAAARPSRPSRSCIRPSCCDNRPQRRTRGRMS